MTDTKYPPLPCPFCGSPADYVGKSGAGYRVECRGCLAQSGWGDYGYQARAKWDARVALATPQPAHQDPLREALTGLNYALDNFWNDGRTDAQLKIVENWQQRSKAALAAPQPAAAPLGLEYARRLNDIATSCEVHNQLGDASDLRIIAQYLARPAAPLGRDGVHPVERLWREVGLPEYFLGNGGTNTKLYALYDAILALSPTPPAVDRAAVIEECAKVADDYPMPDHQSADYDSGFSDASAFIADAIRALDAKGGGGMIIDKFSSLDELKGKDRADPLKILAVLSKVGRFSCFEVDDRMATAMTHLCNSSGWIVCKHDEIVKDKDGQGSHTHTLFPWTYVTLTDAGRAALNGALTP